MGALETSREPRFSGQLSLFADPIPEPTHDAAQPRYRLRRHARTRRLSVTVHPSGRVDVLAPKRTSDRAVSEFVREHEGWIRRTRQSFEAQYGLPDRGLPREISLPGIAREITVNYQSRASATVMARGRDGRVTLSGATHDPEACRKALRRWLSAVARDGLGLRLRSLSRETGLQYQRLQIRAQKTCWGSYSCSGTVSLNFGLVFLRPKLTRYLMLHELCHSRHMNHSRAFWALVRKFEPDCRRLDRELSSAWTEIPAWLESY